MQPTRMPYGSHGSEFFDVYRPDTDVKKLIVLIHGGFFKQKYDLSLMQTMAFHLAKQGYLVVNVEYPRVGEGFKCHQIIRSVFTAFDKAVTLALNVSEHIVIGHSAGGYLGNMLSIRKLLADSGFEMENDFYVPTKIISQAPITDLWRGKQERLSDEGDAIQKFISSETDMEPQKFVYDALSPINYRPTSQCVIHIVHGTKDKDVPIVHSERFMEKWGGTGKVFLHKIDVDHYNIIEPGHISWQQQQALI